LDGESNCGPERHCPVLKVLFGYAYDDADDGSGCPATASQRAAMNPDKAAKWETWIDDIQRDVWKLIDYRRWNAVFERVVNANPRLHRGQTIPDYFRDIYTDYAVLAVRRLVRRDKNSITLTALLDDLRDNHQMLSRNWYRALYKRPLPGGYVYDDETAFQLADETFVDFTDETGNVVSKSMIKADIANIEETICPIIHFSDRIKAHKDKRGVDQLPPYADLDAAVELLVQCVGKYAVLLTGMDSMALVDHTNALEVFTFPWLDLEHRPDLSGLI
jgi:hypothetical protein